MKKIGVLIIFLFLLTNVYSMDISIVGKVNEYSSYEEEVSFTLNCSEKITFSFPKNSKNIRFENNTLITNYNNLTISNCDDITRVYYDLDIVENPGNDIFRLERRFPNIENINYQYSLLIPYDFVISKNESFPSNYSFNYQNNFKTIIFPKNDVYLVYLKKQEGDDSLSFQKLKEEFTESWVIILIILFFSLGYFLSELINRNKRKKDFNIIVPSYVLSNEEKNILTIIKNSPGINQKQIGIEINYSKARVSAIINELESKQLIKREKFGRSFKVYLDKEIK